MRTAHLWKTLAASFIFILFLSPLRSQDYITGIGYRAGLSQGMTVKHFFTDVDAGELMVVTRWKGIMTTGLYEFHTPALGVRNFNWYMGIGLHAGFFQGAEVTWGPENKQYIIAGVDGVLGLEYTTPNLPICIGVNWVPRFSFIGISDFWAEDGALSLRFVF